MVALTIPRQIGQLVLLALILFSDITVNLSFFMMGPDTVLILIFSYIFILSILVLGKVEKGIVKFIFLFGFSFFLSSAFSKMIFYSTAKSIQILLSIFSGMVISDFFYNLSSRYLLLLFLVFISSLLKNFEVLPINVDLHRIMLLFILSSLSVRFIEGKAIDIFALFVILLLIILENSKILLASSVAILAIRIVKDDLKLLGALLILFLVTILWGIYSLKTDLLLERVLDIVDPFASSSTLPRLALAYTGFTAFLNNPIVGVGIGGMNQPNIFMQYYQGHIIDVYASAERIIHHDMIFNERTSGVHNMYIDILASGGIICAFIFGWYLWKCLKNIQHNRSPKKMFIVSFLIYAIGWQFFSVATGAFIVGTFYGRKRHNEQHDGGY